MHSWVASCRLLALFLSSLNYREGGKLTRTHVKIAPQGRELLRFGDVCFMPLRDLIRSWVSILLMSCLPVLLSACSDTVSSAAVTEAWRQPLASPTTYIVRRGDTLYSIAWNYGLDYRQVAATNKIVSPYHIHRGQKLYLKPAKQSVAKKASITPQKEILGKQTRVASSSAAVSTKTKTGVIAKAQANETTVVSSQSETLPPAQVLPGTTVKKAGILWTWPACGRIICSFSETCFSKGIDIAAREGCPIRAAASGKVVYAGNGLRGYGELIIIKHNDEFLSAYAHNKKLLVREGQTVRMGQVIALMGDTEANHVMVHFEIRQAGKPVDPLKYLPSNAR